MIKILFLYMGDNSFWHAKKAHEILDEQYSNEIELVLYDVDKMNENKEIYDKCCEDALSCDFTIISLHGGNTYFYGFKDIIYGLSSIRKKMFYTSGIEDEINEVMQDLGITIEEYATINQYKKVGGIDNWKNMILYICAEILHLDYDYEEVVKLKQEGIYDIDKEIDESRYKEDVLNSDKIKIGVLVHYHNILNKNTKHIDAIVEEIRSIGAIPYCIYSNILPDVENSGLVNAMNSYWFEGDLCIPDVIINTTGFSMSLLAKPGDGTLIEQESIFEKLKVPIIQAMTTYYNYEQWEKAMAGLDSMMLSVCVYQPEYDGQIIAVPICTTEIEKVDGVEKNVAIPIMDRVKKVSKLAYKWGSLKYKNNKDKKVAVIFHNMPPRNDMIGCAHGLDSPKSVYNLLLAMKELGIYLDYDYKDGQEIINKIIESVTNDSKWLSFKEMKKRIVATVDSQTYNKWFNNLSAQVKEKMEYDWGKAPGEFMTFENDILIPGIINGNVFIGLQPPRALDEKADEIYHSTDIVPPHQYVGFYRWIEEEFGADMIYHVGTHGTLEWLPGKEIGLSSSCYSDICIGTLPHMYIYNIGVLGEGIQAKRRSHAVILEHLIPSMEESDTYDDITAIDEAVGEYYHCKQARPEQLVSIAKRIFEMAAQCEMTNDLGLTEDMLNNDPENLVEKIHIWIGEIKESMVRDGLHVFGISPEGKLFDNLARILVRIKNGFIPAMDDSVLEAMGYDVEFIKDNPTYVYDCSSTSIMIKEKANKISRSIFKKLSKSNYDNEIINAIIEEFGFIYDTGSLKKVLKFVCDEVVGRIKNTTDEIKYSNIGLDGGFISPGLGGNPTRGNVNILPTGKNFYASDPTAIPSRAAWETGKKLGDQLIQQHIEEKGSYPESIAIVVYSGETMKNHGEDIAEVLYLMGVRPVYLGKTDKVIGVEAIPYEKLNRSRIDVTLRISGLFRDTFPNIIHRIDEAVMLVSNLDESCEINFIKKHITDEINEMLKEGIDVEDATNKATIRVFGCPPGGYGAGVDMLINNKNWKDVSDLGNIYSLWSGHAYTSKLHGDKMTEVFKKRLSKVTATVKNESSVEIDMLDSDDFYTYHGGLIAAVRTETDEKPLSVVGQTDDPDRPNTRNVNKETARIMRSRIFNPKWLKGLKRHGYKGAQEISSAVDIVFGWDATSDVVENWMYDKITEKFIFDNDTRKWMEDVNKWAVYAVTERLLEAQKRDMWDASEETLEKLRKIYMNIEGKLEDVYE